MSLQNISIIRQTKDLKILEDTDMSFDGIYYKINHTEKSLIAMVIGPDGTPYEGGFYFFSIKLGEKYPFKPPKVEFLTGDGKSRLNPNLYNTGKVCLSILGTWSGPGWTTCMTITTVLLALVTVLNENPIQNEPGYENDIGYRCIEYNKFIEHENIRLAIIQNMNSNEEYIDHFKPIMEKYLERDLEKYLAKVKKIKNYNKTLSANIYSCFHINESSLFFDFFKKLNGYTKVVEFSTAYKSSGKEKNEKKEKIKKKCPSVK